MKSIFPSCSIVTTHFFSSLNQFSAAFLFFRRQCIYVKTLTLLEAFFLHVLSFFHSNHPFLFFPEAILRCISYFSADNVYIYVKTLTSLEAFFLYVLSLFYSNYSFFFSFLNQFSLPVQFSADDVCVYV